MRARLALAAVLGALAALGQAPVGLWPLSVLALAGLFGLVRQTPGWRGAGALGWAAGTGYFVLALNWIVEPFFVDAARHGWMAPFALFLVAVGLGLFWAAAMALTRALGGSAAALIGAVVLAEAGRTYLLTGFPWAQPGHVMIDTPLLHWASVGGSLGLTALVLMAAAGLWHLWRGPRAVGAALVLGPALLLAAAPLLRPEAAAEPGAPLVRLVQPNAPQREKWDPAHMRRFFDRQVAYSAAPARGRAGARRPDLIVWPETALPWTLGRAGPALELIAQAAGGVPVVSGILRSEGRRYFNSLIVLDERGAVGEVYDKHHLVPFGEYVPFGDLLGKIGIRGLAAAEGDGYSAGPGPRVIELGRVGRALPLICYEGVFPQDVGGYDRRPRLLLLITNDAWFGQLSGPYQHLAQARLRSAEQGLPMVRVANTGISAVIDATGRVTDQLALGTEGWVDAPLPPALAPTFYARWGDSPPVAAALALLLWAGWRRRAAS